MRKIIIFLPILLLIFTVWFFVSRNISNKKPKTDETPQVSISPTVVQEVTVTLTESKDTVYTHPTTNFKINIPTGFKAEESGEYSVLIRPVGTDPGPGSANFIYISIVTPKSKDLVGEVYNFNNNDYKKLNGLGIGESLALSSKSQEELAKWFTYTRVDDINIGNLVAKRYENTSPWEFPPGTTETRYVIEDGENLYILGSYTGGQELTVSKIDPRVAHTIITSFKPR